MKSKGKCDVDDTERESIIRFVNEKLDETKNASIREKIFYNFGDIGLIKEKWIHS